MTRCLVLLLLSLVFGGSCLATAEPQGIKIPILMYHHIRDQVSTDTQTLKDLSCSPATFKDHLLYLKKEGYTTITFWDVFEHYQNDTPLPKNPIILTFDDGYADNWSAYKTLKKQNMKGVFFVVVRTIGDTKHLSTEQLMTMSRDGMEIGSHTIDHVDLTSLDKAHAEKQVLHSKALIEEMLGRPIISFCYPEGKLKKETVQILQGSTYWFARTTRPGVSTINGKDYRLKTIRVHNYTSAAQLSHALNNR